MNSLVVRSLLISLLSFSHLRGVIFECNTIEDVLLHLEGDTLIIFDLDDTLIRASNMLASNAWFHYSCTKQQKINTEMSFKDAVQIVLPLFFMINMGTQLELINTKHRSFIENLQQRGLKVIALTNRSPLPLLAERTKDELNRLGIDFSVGSLCDEELTLNITHTGKYSKGIIFCANNRKEETLFLFLDYVKYRPSKIVFVDDKHRHLENVGAAAESRGISFVGMRYSGSDKRKKQFDPLQAEKELIQFKRSIGIAPLEKKEIMCFKSRL